MKNGETIGTMNYDGLIIDGKHDLDVKGVTITLTIAASLLRGTLLSINEDGKAEVFTAAEGQEPDCILTDDLEAKEASEFYVEAYKSGNFNRNMLEEVTDITLTDAHIETLRTKGIFVEAVMK